MYNDLDGCYLRKGTVIPYREGKFDREVSFYNKHLSLAFRGGGAKGLAYAGACRALEEMIEKY
jgi:predicted acylesterase/phospholipase RssA